MVPEAEAQRVNVTGIDTLRFFAALWVAFSHGAAFPLSPFLPKTGAGHFVANIYAYLFNGTAAVVLFFLISGFCIHYPNVGSVRLDWRTFLARRMVRIGVPLVAATAISIILGPTEFAGLNSVLWSIYCEIAYYLAYPIMFLLIRRRGTTPLLGASIAASALVLMMRPQTDYLWQFGLLTPLFCLPMWLAGALLAGSYCQCPPFVARGSIWLWRSGAIILGLGADIALYHPPVLIGFAWSMPAVALYAFFWLQEEFARYREKGATRLWEAMGAFSYSIYLMHNVIIAEFRTTGANPTSVLTWALQLISILAGSYLFYVAVERPGHNTARKIRSKIVRYAPSA